MDFKKILTVLLLSLILISPVFSVSIELNDNDFKEFDKDTKITLEELEFTIPKGYGEFGEYDLSEELGLFEDAENKCYINSETGDIIAVAVATYFLGYDESDLDDVREEGYVDKTISGHDGVFAQDNGTYAFQYIDDDKFVIVVSSDKELFEKIIN